MTFLVSFGLRISCLIVGVSPLFFTRSDDIPKPDIGSAAAKDVGNSPNLPCNCLGRDTIANAAAKIGPAVVNLSVPQGPFSLFHFFLYILLICRGENHPLLVHSSYLIFFYRFSWYCYG